MTRILSRVRGGSLSPRVRHTPLSPRSDTRRLSLGPRAASDAELSDNSRRGGRGGRKSSGAWSKADDKKLCDARRAGDNWNDIVQTCFRGLKSPNACRKRHERLKQKEHDRMLDDVRHDELVQGYMRQREAMWSLLACHLGFRDWKALEHKCFRKGVKNLEASYRQILRDTGAAATVPEHSGEEASDNEDSASKGEHAAGPAAETRPQSQTMSVYAVLSPIPVEDGSAAPSSLPGAYPAGSGSPSPAHSYTPYHGQQQPQLQPQLAYRGLSSPPPPPPAVVQRAGGDCADTDAAHKSDWVYVQHSNAQGLPSPTASSHDGARAGSASPRAFAGGPQCPLHAQTTTSSAAAAFAYAYSPPPQGPPRQYLGQPGHDHQRQHGGAHASNRLPPIDAGYFGQRHGQAPPAGAGCVCLGAPSCLYHARDCNADRI